MTCKWQTLPKKSSALRFCSAIRPTVYSMGFLICRLCVQISHTCEKCDKWRALGSEVLFIQKRVGSENSPHCCVCMPKLHLVKKVVSCNRRVLSSRQIFMLSRNSISGPSKMELYPPGLWSATKYHWLLGNVIWAASKPETCIKWQ